VKKSSFMVTFLSREALAWLAFEYPVQEKHGIAVRQVFQDLSDVHLLLFLFTGSRFSSSRMRLTIRSRLRRCATVFAHSRWAEGSTPA